MTRNRPITRTSVILLVSLAGLTGGCEFFGGTMQVDAEMQETLKLPSALIKTDDYPRLRDKYDAIMRKKAEDALAEAKRIELKETKELEKARQVSEQEVLAAQRQQQTAVHRARSKCDDAVRTADSTLAADLIGIGDAFDTAVASTTSSFASAQMNATSAIETANQFASQTITSLRATRDSTLKSGDASYSSAKETLDGWKSTGEQIASTGVPMLASVLGIGGVGVTGLSLLAAGIFRRKQTQSNSALDGLNHGLQDAAKDTTPIAAILPTGKTIQDLTIADVTKIIQEGWINSQVQTRDLPVLQASTARA